MERETERDRETQRDLGNGGNELWVGRDACHAFYSKRTHSRVREHILQQENTSCGLEEMPVTHVL